MSLDTKVRPKEKTVKEEAVIEPPPMFRVLLLNDDYTPMDFVVEVLKKFFYMSEDVAINVMLTIHNHGKAVCGVYPRDIAQTKVAIICDFVKTHNHPLACVMEEDK